MGTLGDVSWGFLTSFAVSAGSSDFVVGTNTLSIDLTATDSFLEGVNLRGSLTGYTPIPERMALPSLMAGMGMLIGFARRKRT